MYLPFIGHFLVQLPSLPPYFFTYLKLIKYQRHTCNIKEQKEQIFKTSFLLVLNFIYLFLFFPWSYQVTVFKKLPCPFQSRLTRAMSLFARPLPLSLDIFSLAFFSVFTDPGYSEPQLMSETFSVDNMYQHSLMQSGLYLLHGYGKHGRRRCGILVLIQFKQ